MMDEKAIGRIEERLIQLQATSDQTHTLVRNQGIEMAKQGEQIKDAFRQIRERVTVDKHDALVRRVEENRAEKLDSDSIEPVIKAQKKTDERMDKIEGWVMKGLWAVCLSALGAVASIVLTLFDKPPV